MPNGFNGWIKGLLAALMISWLGWVSYSLQEVKSTSATVKEQIFSNSARIEKLEETLALVKERQDERLGNFDKILLRMDRVEDIIRNQQPERPR